MKCVFTALVIASTSLFAVCGESDQKLYKLIEGSNRNLIQHKVFKQDGFVSMKLESKPFQWLNNELNAIAELDKIRFKSVVSLNVSSPIGNDCVTEKEGELNIKIPDTENKNGNGLDYKWFSLVWGIEYFKRQNEINKLIELYETKEISQEEMVEKLSRIRVDVIINVRKFYDNIWTPWCVEVGAIPNSPLTWLKHVEVKDPDVLYKKLVDSGDIKRIKEWVLSLK